MQKVLSAFRHKIHLTWSIREYSSRLTACQNVRSAKLEADLMKDFPPLTPGALQLIKTPCIVVDSEDNIVLWYLPEALTIRRHDVFMGQLVPLNQHLSQTTRQNTDAGQSSRKSRFYYPKHSRITTGELSMSPCWNAVGHPTFSSSPILKEPTGLHFLRDANESLALLGAALWLLHPRLARRACEVMERIRQGRLNESSLTGMEESRRFWPTPFTAMAVISNKAIGGESRSSMTF
ncbi:hypothetical protein BDZ97DRAFT_1771744 [Flammula alnicola]|nr:hypothetical protein BDZ97DRAFT_1771744 [Flammula alnicola]